MAPAPVTATATAKTTGDGERDHDGACMYLCMHVFDACMHVFMFVFDASPPELSLELRCPCAGATLPTHCYQWIPPAQSQPPTQPPKATVLLQSTLEEAVLLHSTLKNRNWPS